MEREREREASVWRGGMGTAGRKGVSVCERVESGRIGSFHDAMAYRSRAALP